MFDIEKDGDIELGVPRPPTNDREARIAKGAGDIRRFALTLAADVSMEGKPIEAVENSGAVVAEGGLQAIAAIYENLKRTFGRDAAAKYAECVLQTAAAIFKADINTTIVRREG